MIRESTTANRKPRPQVYLIDSDEAVRTALKQNGISRDWETVTLSCSKELLARSQDVRGCLVLDMELPNGSALELQRELMTHDIQIPIIFTTSRGDVPTTVRAMKAGAMEFLTKPILEDDLVTAVEEAIDRSSVVIERQRVIRDLRARYSILTKREREVMALVVVGSLNKQIAHELGISEITVKAHRGSLVRKMQARSFAELVIMGSRLDLTVPN